MHVLLFIAACIPSLWQEQVLYELQQINRMPPDLNAIVPTDTAIADSIMVGRPEQFQDPYRAVSERYPVSTPAPRFQVPMAEQMAQQEWQTQQMGRQTAIQGQQLNQRITQEQLRYDQNINRQAEEAIGRIGELNPGADDYEEQRAAFVKQFPLAIQNPAFNTMMGRLDSSFAQQRQANDILGRSEIARTEQRNFAYEQMANQQREQVAKFGESFLKDYDQALAANGGDPTAAFAVVAGKINQERNRQLEEKPMTPAQVQRARLDLIAAKNKVLDRRKEVGYEWSPDDQSDLDAIQEQLRSLGANPSNTSPSGTPAPRQDPRSLLPKLSTKQGP